jgi:glutathione peroxidase-family protein
MNLKNILIGVGITLGTLGLAGYFYAPFIATLAPAKTSTAIGQVRNNAPAPDFMLMGVDGKAHQLSDYFGKIVILEWTSPQCEFTANHYNSGTMQALQRQARGQGAVWLTIDSGTSPTEKLDAAGAMKRLSDLKMDVDAFLLDDTGQVGRRYGARTTPSIFIVDGGGLLRYQGAVDNQPWGKGSLDPAQNYVLQALTSLKAGTPIKVSATRPYGCGIKY